MSNREACSDPMSTTLHLIGPRKHGVTESSLTRSMHPQEEHIDIEEVDAGENQSKVSAHKESFYDFGSDFSKKDNKLGTTCELSIQHSMGPGGGIDNDFDMGELPMTDGPLPHPSHDLAESLIAKKMSKLSVAEREKVYFDIHGIADVIDENAEVGFLDRKLEEMNDQILKINPSERKAYDMARTMDCKYVDDWKFRLRFLRVEHFDTERAAVRYVRHYETKLSLFGPEKLGKHILQDDLDHDALDNLYCGHSQILPQRDSAGRLVILWVAGAKQQSYSIRALMQRIYYNGMVISEDLESQRKGTVMLIYTLKQEQTNRGEQGINRIRDMAAVNRSLPISIASVHFCYDSYVWIPVVSLAKMSSHLFVQLRFRSHYGKHSDCMHKLQTFGVLPDSIPVDAAGNVHVNNYRRFLERRRAQEKEWTTKWANNQNFFDIKFPSLIIPTKHDILLGRGRGYFNHVGNFRYRALIEAHKEQYDQDSRQGKRKIAEDIIAIVQSYGGRFLKDDKGAWVLPDSATTLEKVTHSFRALRSPARSQDYSDLIINKIKSTNREERGHAAPIAKRICRD